MAGKPTTPWGGIGQVVHARTYARRRDADDASKGVENFDETIGRVVGACATQLGCGFTQEEEAELTAILLGLKGCVAGRFMWQLGTKTVEKYGLMSLQNCAAAAMRDPVETLTWMFDASLLGVGVGYSIEDEYVVQMPVVQHATLRHTATNDASYIVPDTREGWVNVVRHLLELHFGRGDSCELEYSTILIRPRGSVIRSFGGVASGPECLIHGLTQVNRVLNECAGQRPSAVVILDVANLLGQIVASGGVRRSAQLALGSPTNTAYLRAKRWDLGPVPHWRSNSNNSVVVSNISELSDDFWAGYDGRGEPYGLVNLDLARRAGQVGQPARHDDAAVVATNPCVVGDSIVMTPDGPIQMKDLVAQFSTARKSYATVSNSVCEIKNAWLTRTRAVVVEVQTWEGFSVRCTPDHRFWVNLVGGELKWMEARNLSSEAGTDSFANTHFADDDVSCGSEKANPPRDSERGRQPALVLNRTHIARPSWPGTVSGLGPFATTEDEWACGYALGALLGDGTITVSKEGHAGATFTFFDSGEMHVKCMRWVECAHLACKPADRPPRKWRHDAGRRTWTLADDRDFYRRVMEPLGIRRGNKRVTAAVECTSSNFQSGVLAGLFDTDGMVNIEGRMIAFSQATYETVHRMQRMLLCRGIMSRVRVQPPAVGNMMVRDDASVARIQATHSIFRLDIISPHFQRFSECIPLQHALKAESLRVLGRAYGDSAYEPDDPIYFRATVKRVVPLTMREDVYDVTVSGAEAFGCDGMIAHNCAEQVLHDFETCCLAEVVLPNCKTEHELRRTIEYLYRICKHSLRLPCHWKQTEDIVHANMRMGIGVTGYLQASEEQRQWLPAAAKWMDAFDATYSADRGWPQSIRLRTVKPSGTISLLAGVTAGCHAAYARWCLKRMRFSSTSPLIAEAQRRGYHTEPVEYMEEDPELGTAELRHDPNTIVVDFPIEYPEGTPVAEDVDAIAQMDVVRRLQRDWSDNAVSVTVTYRVEELPAIRAYLEEHYTDEMKAVSFLMRSGHGFRQAPWTPISEAEFRQRTAAITEPFGGESCVADTMDEDETVDLDSACAGGACPIR